MAQDLTQSIFDVAGLNSQFVAILLGAFLASAGGFLVTWLLDRMERQRQERSIALVCLDLLTSLSVMTQLAQRARSRGDPYGPYTLRLVRGCLRDVDVYERNRERIADISDPEVRAEIYQCMTRLTLSLDGVLSETEIIDRIDQSLLELRISGSPLRVDELTRERDERCGRRDSSFDFMLETTQELGEPLAAKLRVIAKADPHSLQEILSRQTTPGPPANTSPPSQS